MILYPAIDIKNGQCVRLRQGQFHDVEIYSNVPANVAKDWESQGAEFIHIVDLDGALVGHSVNDDVIRETYLTALYPVISGDDIISSLGQISANAFFSEFSYFTFSHIISSEMSCDELLIYRIPLFFHSVALFRSPCAAKSSTQGTFRRARAYSGLVRPLQVWTQPLLKLKQRRRG